MDCSDSRYGSQEREISYLHSTLKFCIAGFLIPGFTAVVIVGFQLGMGLLGIECTIAWKIIWTLTSIGSVTVPLLFVSKMNERLESGYHLTTDKLMIFNII